MKRYLVHITPHGCWIDGNVVPTQTSGDEIITELYRAHVGDYPKFFKMDGLCRLAFIASELVLQAEAKQNETQRFTPNETRNVILGNHSASIKNDNEYLNTISDGNFYPSPALFVYTLPNITTGEIAIRNKYFGETCFFVAENQQQFEDLINTTQIDDALVGWIEYTEQGIFDCSMWLQSSK